MTALLTDNLPLLAGAPNGIKKLRELILELAVRGKLVPQDPTDEPASELLKRITENKARLVAEGKIKRQKPLQEIAEDEWPFVLPVGWEWSRLGDVSEYIQRGKGPVYVDQSSFRVVSQKCVRWSGLDLQPARFIAPESLVKYESIRFLRSGDILWNSTGTGTIGRACVVEDCSEEEQLVADSHVTVVRPTGLLPVFLWRWIQSPSVQSELEGNASGTTNQIELNTSTVIAHLTPIPPLAEQHRIIAKVDELMALCDRLEARQADADSAHAQLMQALLDSLTQARDAEDFAQSWQRLAEHFHILFTTESSIDALKQTLLQLAVMGKLVPQVPSDEPASELLKRIAEEKARLVADGKIKKQKPLGEIAVSDIPFDVPDSWAWSRIGEIALNTEYGLSEKTFDLQDGVPVLKMGDIQEGKVLLGGQMAVSKSTEGLPELYLEPEDLLYNRTNSAELVGKTGIFLGQAGKYSFASYLIRIRCLKELFSPLYLNTSMNAPGFRETQINPHLKQQCGQANVNGTIMKNMLVSVPPLAEQHRIVAKVDELMALCDQLKARLNQARQVHEQLANALVEQAVA
ncbi:TPA: restriction endonuclease subunit S [Pseudomonas aeruginosa]